jgi:hypothetical protein
MRLLSSLCSACTPSRTCKVRGAVRLLSTVRRGTARRRRVTACQSAERKQRATSGSAACVLARRAGVQGVRGNVRARECACMRGLQCCTCCRRMRICMRVHMHSSISRPLLHPTNTVSKSPFATFYPLSIHHVLLSPIDILRSPHYIPHSRFQSRPTIVSTITSQSHPFITPPLARPLTTGSRVQATTCRPPIRNQALERLLSSMEEVCSVMLMQPLASLFPTRSSCVRGGARLAAARLDGLCAACIDD